MASGTGREHSWVRNEEKRERELPAKNCNQMDRLRDLMDLHFLLSLRPPLAPPFARRLARGLRPLELTASLLVFVA